MDVFYRERELCKLFKSKKKEFTITFDINPQEVTIYVRHFRDWDSQKGKVILDKFWKNFKLPLIGWKNNCKLFNYKRFIDDEFISEYIFTMQKFDDWKIMDCDFLNYNNKYISILTEQN